MKSLESVEADQRKEIELIIEELREKKYSFLAEISKGISFNSEKLVRPYFYLIEEVYREIIDQISDIFNEFSSLLTRDQYTLLRSNFLQQLVNEINQILPLSEVNRETIRKFLVDFENIEFELNQEESALFVEMMNEPNLNANDFRKKSNKLFLNIDLSSDEIPIKISRKKSV